MKLVRRLRAAWKIAVSSAGDRPTTSPRSVALGDMLALIYGPDHLISNAVRAEICAMLGRDKVDSLADMRAITMMLDRQSFPTPLIVRLSDDDIGFAPVNGVEVSIDRHDRSVSAGGGASGVYETHLAACFERLCKPGMVALDIGANVGFHTMLLARLVGAQGHVHAFEPNSENCRLILMAAEHGGVDNLTLLPIALSDRRGWSHFSSHIGSNGGFVGRQLATLHGHGTVVPMLTLDELGLDRADIIKIDIEGAEPRALKGGEALIARCRPAIICEFSVEMMHRVSDADPRDFLGWIAGFGYRIAILDRQSGAIVPTASPDALLSDWGSHLRIEDLLFVPNETSTIFDA